MLEGRHTSVQQIGRHLVPNPNLPPHLREISEFCEMTAAAALDRCQDGPELTAGLRKLLEAKDCFVRARLDGDRDG